MSELTKCDRNNIIGWPKAHSNTGFSVNDWKSSKPMRRLKQNSSCTVEPRYSEDPVTTNIWKSGRITVKICGNKPRYNEIPTRYNELILTVPSDNLPRYNEYFVLVLSVSKNDMMIQMADKPNTTRIGKGRGTLTFKALLYLNVAFYAQVCRLFWVLYIP